MRFPQHRPEVLRGCANARQLSRICDVLEGQTGHREISWDLSRGRHHLAFTILGDPELLGILEEDPDVRPYLWDLQGDC